VTIIYQAKYQSCDYVVSPTKKIEESEWLQHNTETIDVAGDGR
jgi:hypothetical protein